MENGLKKGGKKEGKRREKSSHKPSTGAHTHTHKSANLTNRATRQRRGFDTKGFFFFVGGCLCCVLFFANNRKQQQNFPKKKKPQPNTNNQPRTRSTQKRHGELEEGMLFLMAGMKERWGVGRKKKKREKMRKMGRRKGKWRSSNTMQQKQSKHEDAACNRTKEAHKRN